MFASWSFQWGTKMKKGSHPSSCRCKSFVICKYNRPHGTVFCALEEKPPSDSEVALHITICDTGVGMDGYAAARAIRYCGKPDAETIPILAMTANAFDDDRQKSLPAGMNDYLSKPLDIPKLTEAIQKFRTTPTDSGGLVG